MLTAISKTKAQSMFALMGQWTASGATKKAFCDQQGINNLSLFDWAGFAKRKEPSNSTRFWTTMVTNAAAVLWYG
jgi:hypothetical protein